MAKIFISHSHSDWRLAESLHDLLKGVSGNRFQIDRSSEKGAIKIGENWREWIDDKVATCDVAIILLTPASVRGRWVMWEAGAVAGVRLLGAGDGAAESAVRAASGVRVMHFNFDKQDLGPFSTLQVCRGLDAPGVVQFVKQLLSDFSAELGQHALDGLVKLEGSVRQFVERAAENLRYTPIEPSEGVVQHWLQRLDEARDRQDDAWIIAARRWVNVSFLGAEQASAHELGEPIDFRLHIRFAAAHRRLRDWLGVVQQLKLAAQLSPNDLVVLRDLGRAYRELQDKDALAATLSTMLALDLDVFKKDREAIALRCGYFADLGANKDLHHLLNEADQALVARDPYLLFWRSLTSMRVEGPAGSEAYFRQLGQLLDGRDGFWDEANRVNVHLALGELDAATALLQRFSEYGPSKDELASASRYYDEILRTFGRKFDWEGHARSKGKAPATEAAAREASAAKTP